MWIGVALAVLQLVAYLGTAWAADQFGRFFPDDPRLIATIALLLAYLPTAQAYHRRWTRRHLESLRPLLEGPPAAGALRPAPVSRAAGAIGVLVFAVPFLLVPALEVPDDRPVDWGVLAVLLLGWLTGRFAQAVYADARRVSRLASRLSRVELFDLAPLAPFVQQGLRSAFLIAVLVSIGGLYVVRPTDTQHLAGMMANVTATVLFAVAVLLLPLDGLRRRLRTEKDAALGELRGVIAAERRAALGAGEAAQRARGGLPGLLALEARLAGVGEWQLSAPSLGRFALYVLLGLGSWVGAAWVERLLDRLLE